MADTNQTPATETLTAAVAHDLAAYRDEFPGEEPGRLASWERKAHEMIYRYSREAYLRANTPNKATRKLLRHNPSVRLYKRHRPYTIPAIAEALVNALAIHDDSAREHEIKRLLEIEREGAWSLI